MTRVLTMFLRYGDKKYPLALQQVNALYEARLPGVQRRTLVIDNALPPDFEASLDRSTVLIGGDNSSWEFSAWDRGLAYVGKDVWNFDYVNLVTSAFNELYNAYLQRLSNELLKVLRERPTALGHIDCYNQPVRFEPFEYQHWIRSCFMFLPPSEIKALGSLVTVRNGQGIFTDNPLSPFQNNSPLSQNYRDYIVGWLTGSGTGQGVVWHSRFELNNETFPYFQQKALTILNEQLLSVRLRALGCQLIDVTWISSRDNSQIKLATPWETQLRERRTDQVIV